MSVEDETWDRPDCPRCGKRILHSEATQHGTGRCTVPDLLGDWPAAVRLASKVPALDATPSTVPFAAKLPATPLQFDGATYEPARDRSRLKAQLDRVKRAMAGGVWLTLAQLSAATGDPEASVSARLRDCRKARFGGHTVEREYVERGLFRYRLLDGAQAALAEAA